MWHSLMAVWEWIRTNSWFSECGNLNYLEATKAMKNQDAMLGTCDLTAVVLHE